MIAAISSPWRPPAAPRSVEHLAGALLGGLGERFQRLAVLEVGQSGDDQRMARQDLVEVLVNLLGLPLVPVPRQEAPVGVDEPQRGPVGVVGRGEPRARGRLVAHHVGDQPGMEIPERDEIIVREAIAIFDRLLLVAAAGPGPGRQQGREDVAARRGAVLGELRARLRPLVALQRLHAEHEMGEPVGRLLREQPVGQSEGIEHVAVGQRRDEGALDELRVARVETQRLAREGGGGRRVVIGTGDDGGEVIAGRAVGDLERARQVQALPRRGGRPGGQPCCERRRNHDGDRDAGGRRRRIGLHRHGRHVPRDLIGGSRLPLFPGTMAVLRWCSKQSWRRCHLRPSWRHWDRERRGL